MNKNILYIVLVVIVVVGLYMFVSKKNTDMMMNNMDDQMTATTSDQMTASTTATTPDTGTQGNTNAKVIAGYPVSWPADVPKYPNGVVNEKGGNNPKSLPNEAVVVFTTGDSVKSVVDFYVQGLKASGWTITEDGAGTANMTTIRATKGKRSVGGYVHKETTGKTEATIGINVGL